MQSAKKYAPFLYFGVQIICAILIIIGAAGFIFTMFDRDFLIVCALFPIGFALFFDFWVACEFFEIAVDKGYTSAKYLVIPFVLPVIGQMLIVAMPDKNLWNLKAATAKREVDASEPCVEEALENEDEVVIDSVDDTVKFQLNVSYVSLQTSVHRITYTVNDGAKFELENGKMANHTVAEGDAVLNVTYVCNNIFKTERLVITVVKDTTLCLICDDDGLKIG